MRKFYFLLILSAFVVMFSHCQKKTSQSVSQNSKEKFGVWVKESVVCKNVENRTPQNITDQFQTDQYIKIFYFTRIGALQKGTKVYHRYAILQKNINGEKFWEETHITPLTINTTNYRTWSYKTVYPGEWRVDVLAQDQTSIITTKFFSVTGPKKEEPNFDEPFSGTMTLPKSVLCESIKDKKPVNETTIFGLNGQKTVPVWIWLEVKTDVFPANIYLQWSRSASSIENKHEWVPIYISHLPIKAKTWHTRGSLSLPKGEYRLDILNPTGKKILKTYEFSVEDTAL